MSGTAYHVEARAGPYLHAGDLVANVGRLERLRVSVYVDEPDLGRVAAGMPVTVTWDALPGRTWQGVVERIATQIVRLESRQVGEVGSVIGNPGRDLAPGANINVAIRSRVAENAVALPKECLRREGGVTGVEVRPVIR